MTNDDPGAEPTDAEPDPPASRYRVPTESGPYDNVTDTVTTASAEIASQYDVRLWRRGVPNR